MKAMIEVYEGNDCIGEVYYTNNLDTYDTEQSTWFSGYYGLHMGITEYEGKYVLVTMHDDKDPTARVISKETAVKYIVGSLIQDRELLDDNLNTFTYLFPELKDEIINELNKLRIK